VASGSSRRPDKSDRPSDLYGRHFGATRFAEYGFLKPVGIALQFILRSAVALFRILVPLERPRPSLALWLLPGDRISSATIPACLRPSLRGDSLRRVWDF
jgi:hypothetical protein